MNKLQDFYVIDKELDWYQEARGHFACVNQAYDVRNNQQVAFKVIRKEYLWANEPTNKYDGEWEAFCIEVRALQKFHTHDFSVRFVDCGYVEVAQNADMPRSNNTILSLGNTEEAVEEFVSIMPNQRKIDMRPYIVTEYIDHHYGTIFVIDPENETMYRRYCVTDVLSAISQFIDLLVYLQDNNYVYLDHKLAHTYWLLETGHLKVIDWNGGFFLSDLSPSTRAKKLLQENRHLIGMVMYGLLTGKPSPGYGKLEEMGRSIGNLKIPDHCPGHLLIQQFMDETIQNTYKNARELRARFDQLMLDYGMDVNGQRASDDHKQARERVDNLMQEARNIYNLVEQFTDLLVQRKTLEGLPAHFREEVRNLHEVFRELKDAQPIILK